MDSLPLHTPQAFAILALACLHIIQSNLLLFIRLHSPPPLFVVRPWSLSLNLTPWPESASELYRPSDRRLSVKLMPIFADRGCHVFSVTDPYRHILDFLDRVGLSLSLSLLILNTVGGTPWTGDQQSQGRCVFLLITFTLFYSCTYFF
jgi:hypothetical protein